MTEVEHARDGGQPDVSLQGNQLPEQTQLSTPPGDLNGEHICPHSVREGCLDLHRNRLEDIEETRAGGFFGTGHTSGHNRGTYPVLMFRLSTPLASFYGSPFILATFAW